MNRSCEMIRGTMRRSTFTSLSALLFALLPAGQGQTAFTVTTVAGNGTVGYSGDSGPALNAALGNPMGVAADSAGNYYIADTNNNVIRKVASNGTITTFAGTGVGALGGDGGPATEAFLFKPQRVFLDSVGDLYIADQFNNRIRKVSADGIITTVAGLVQGYCGDGGPAIDACINGPLDAVTNAAGNLYIAEWGSSVIRKVDTRGIITTIAGNGIPGYSGDGGPATSASLYGPQGVAINAAGQLFIADSGNYRIRMVVNGIITTVAGTGVSGYSGDDGPAVNAQLTHMGSIRLDSTGSLLIPGGGRIRAILPDGTITTIAGDGTFGDTGDGGFATAAEINANAVAINPNGGVYFSDPTASRIRLLTPATQTVTIVSAASSLVEPLAPGSIATAYGTDLATTSKPATTLPLPLSLAGTTINLLDSAGVTTPAPIFYISPGQVNFFIPEGVADGAATVTFTSGDGSITTGTLTIAAVSPAIFVLNSTGLAAATTVIVNRDGTIAYGDDFQVSGNAITPLPINLGPPTQQVFLVLYGTGISGRTSLANVTATFSQHNLQASPISMTVPVAYAGPQGDAGLDQVNVSIPLSLAGSGTTNVSLTVDGITSNTVTIDIM